MSIRFALWLVLFTWTAGCGRPADSSTVNAATTPVTVRIGYQKIGAPFLLKERAEGLRAVLAKHNATAQFIEFQAGPPILEAMRAGAVDIGYTGDAPPVIMFQEPRLLPWRSVLQNVMLGVTPPDPRAARAALEEVGFTDRASDCPSVLSGGQRQRVALARALMHRPTLLLLDEPFGALDALTRTSAQNLVQTLWREHGFTAVLVTHDVDEAVLLSDHVLVIEDGRVVYREPVELARPRARSSPEVGRITARVLSAIFGDAGERKPAPAKNDVPRGAVAAPRTTGL
jgi:sulfonate transport system ATP-binding protein